jgi:hypothetical protein
MHSYLTYKARFRRGNSSGAALVLTLLIVALLTVVVVGFNASTRTEQMAARNYSYQVVADQMADLATEQAVASLRAALTNAARSGYATAPGMLVPLGESAPIGLYSSNSTRVSTPQSTDAEFAGWITGRSSPQPGFQDVESSAGGSNQVVGRYAYFVDDETTKISLNSSSGGIAAGATNFFDRPFAIGVVPPLASAAGALSSYAAATNLASPSYFFVPRQARALNGQAAAADWKLWLPVLTTIQDTRLNAPFTSDLGGAAGVNSAGTRSPWGAAKININQVALTDAGVNQIANALTNARLNTLFEYQGSGPRGFGYKYPNLVPQIAANLLALRSPWWSQAYFSGGNNFAPPQAATPAFPLGHSADTYPPGFDVDSWPLTTGGRTPATTGTLKKTFAIPEAYFGVVPFPMLTEISPSVVYGWTASNTMTVRIYMTLEFFNPYPISFDADAPNVTAGIVAQIDKARFEMIYPGGFTAWRGPDGTSVDVAPHNDRPGRSSAGLLWDPWGAGDPNGQTPADVSMSLDPPGGIKVWPLPDVPAGSYATEFVFFDVTFKEDNDAASLTGPVYCIIDSIRILQNTNDPRTIRDWVSGHDFFNALATSAAGPAQFAIPVDPAPGGSFVVSSPTTPLPNGTGGFAAAAPQAGPSMAKRDPRMRTPLAAGVEWDDTVQPGWAWVANQGESLGAANPGLAPAAFAPGPDVPLPGDQDFAQNILSACFPPMVGGRYPGLLNSGSYRDPSDIGKVFTGVPWRTLSLAAQTEGELRDPAIPDWVVLDIFSIVVPPSAPAVAAVPVNPNAIGQASGGGFGLAERVAATMRSRSQPTLGSGSAAQVAEQIANQRWSSSFLPPGSTNSWSGARKQFGFPTNTILLPSEVAEIASVADFGGAAMRSTNETRLSGFYPLLSTSSRFFSVFAHGEAVADRRGKKEIMAVSRKKTFLEALVDPDSGAVRIEKLFSEPYPQ